uniref:Bm13631 n=1 Tax=Brugia malayi TaxID=6279 RepID=A0A1I9G625_BRUMA|nr:Bm13631 [Brugia malayi]
MSKRCLTKKISECGLGFCAVWNSNIIEILEIYGQLAQLSFGEEMV